MAEDKPKDRKKQQSASGGEERMGSAGRAVVGLILESETKPKARQRKPVSLPSPSSRQTCELEQENRFQEGWMGRSRGEGPYLCPKAWHSAQGRASDTWSSISRLLPSFTFPNLSVGGLLLQTFSRICVLPSSFPVSRRKGHVHHPCCPCAKEDNPWHSKGCEEVGQESLLCPCLLV